MNKEEKEAIEKLKNTYFNYETYYLVETAINLIDTLQKENRELKEENNKLKRENEALEIIHETYREVVDNGNYISKDIIRNKIKELEERNKMFKLELPEDVTIYQYGIEVLKELLGE